MTDRLPTVPQMRNRSLSGHRRALECIRDGRPCVGPGAPVSEVRGMRTVLATLARWECVASDYTLTDRGRELLDALTGAVRP